MAGEQPMRSAEPRRQTITSNGDLQLQVGSELQDVREIEFLVDSVSLVHSSPFLKALLGPNWQEARPSDAAIDWVVQLPEDNPKTMRILLNIMHDNFSGVPKALNLDSLVDICTLADKYKLVHLLRDWAARWIAPFRTQLVLSYRLESELWVSWVLGDRYLFEKRCLYMIKNSVLEVNREGEKVLVLADRTLIQALLDRQPNIILAHIESERAKALDKIFGILKSVHERWKVNQHIRPKCPEFLYDRMMSGYNIFCCDRFSPDELVRQLSAEKLLPIPKADKWAGSVEELIKTLRGLFYRKSGPVVGSCPTCAFVNYLEVQSNGLQVLIDALPPGVEAHLNAQGHLSDVHARI